jgi:hypothetical protein
MCETFVPGIEERTQTEGVENRVQGSIYGPGRHKVTGGWRGLRIEELHDLYSSLRIIRMARSRVMMVRACSTSEKRNANRIVVEKPEGKGPLGRPR